MAFHVSQLGNLTCCRSEAQMSAPALAEFSRAKVSSRLLDSSVGRVKRRRLRHFRPPGDPHPVFGSRTFSSKARTPQPPKGSRRTFLPLTAYS